MTKRIFLLTGILMLITMFANAAHDPVIQKMQLQQQAHVGIVAEAVVADQITITAAEYAEMNKNNFIARIAEHQQYNNLIIPALEVPTVLLFRPVTQIDFNNVKIKPPVKKDCKHKVPERKRQMKKQSKPKYVARQWRQQLKKNN